MKRALVVAWLCIITIIASAQTVMITGVFDYGKARHVVDNINRLRQANGLKPLQMEASLTEAAMLRAAELAYRKEDEQEGQLSVSPGKRPNGGNDRDLIAEQYNTFQLPASCESIHLIQEQFIDFGMVIKSLKSKSNVNSTFYNASMRAVGCGAFLSQKGHFYWVLFFIPNEDRKTDIPSGQYNVQVQIGLGKGVKTQVVSKTKSETDQTPTSFEVTVQFDYKAAIEVVELTNRERKAKGLKPLIMDSTLMELAMIRAAEMLGIKDMTHTRPNGLPATSIISPYMNWSYKGENIAYGQESAEEVVAQWMTSTGHRANILNESYNRMGAGKCGQYWVQLFVKTSDKLPTLSKSAARIDEVVVEVTIVPDGRSKVLKRTRVF